MIFLLFFCLLFMYWAGRQEQLTWWWKHHPDTPLISCTLEGQPQKLSNFDVVPAEIQSCLLSFVVWQRPELTYCREVQCSNCRWCKLLSPVCWCLLLHLIVVANVIRIMQSGSLYLAETDQLLCLSSLCFSHTQRAWQTPQECPVWCVGDVGL